MTEATLPRPTRERWEPLRSGLLNLFRYDHEEFLWEKGHLLLRGNNGTGKSRVLALQLPFLLDGEVAPSRLEPDGDAAKRIEWNLLLDRYKDRLGYTWLELGRVDAEGEHFLTLGCGLQAAEGRGLTNKWFFVTRQRIGQDLFLQSAGGQALTREKLEEEIGAHGEVFRTATAYRKEVDARLFKLGEQRYGALVDLLIELRKPQLSRHLDEAELSNALSEAMAPPSQALLADVAEAFRGLETDRGHLTSFEKALSAAESFLKRYQHYAQVAARRRAAGVRKAHSEYEGLQRSLREAEAAQLKASSDQQQAVADLEQLKVEEQRVQAESEALAGSEAMRNAEALDAARVEAERRKAAAARAEEERSRAAASSERAGEDSKVAATRAQQARSALNDSLADCAFHAEGCALTTVHQAAVQVLGAPPYEARAAASFLRQLEAAGGKRLKEARLLAQADREVVRSSSELAQARSAQLALEAERDGALAREREARKEGEQAVAGLLGAYRTWSGSLRELAPAESGSLEEDVREWAERADGPSPIRAAVQSAFVAANDRIAAARSEAAQALRAQGEIAEGLEKEKAALESGQHQPPPAPHTRAAEREGRAGAPLWRLCDFAPGLGPGERAGLEAALEASGLLDAWVTPDGRLLDGVHDAFVIPESSPLPPEGQHLGHALVPAIDPKDARCAGMGSEVVKAVLRQVGLGSDSGPVRVEVSGRWQLGPLHGAWAKAAAEHIGEGAREALRRERLAAVVAQLAEAKAKLAVLRRALEQVASRAATAKQELERSPGDEGVLRATAQIGAAAREAAGARARLAAAEKVTAERRRTHEEAVSRRDQAAQDLGLTKWVEKAVELEDAVQGYLRALARLSGKIESSRAAFEQEAAAASALERARAFEGRAREASLVSRGEAEAASQRWQTLEQTVGAEAREVLARRGAARRKLEQIHERERQSGLAERDAFARKARAEGEAEKERQALGRQAEVRDRALQALERFAKTKLLVTAVRELAEVEAGPWAPTRGVDIARLAEQQLGSVDADDSAWERNHSEIQRSVQQLIAELGAQQLRPSFEVVDDVLVVEALFQGRSCSMSELTDDLRREVADRQRLLNAREHEIIENHLIGEVASHLHERLRAGESLVATMNSELERCTTSTGMKLRFEWEALEESRPGLAEVRKRLLRTSATWSAKERAAVGEFLQSEIRRVRAADEAATWQEHLALALDYRKWHRFAVERFQDGRWKKLTKRTHGTGSGGEKAIALTIPKFAAAAAHYKTADRLAPRLILLDEAFVGVDSDMRSKSFGLLQAFDLDFLLTSEREWGCYRTISGLGIYQLATRPGIDAIGVTRWVWNGEERISADHRVSPSAPENGAENARREEA
ncbi:MAG: TIGR02680 family protein [Myxococcales bacterium]